MHQLCAVMMQSSCSAVFKIADLPGSSFDNALTQPEIEMNGNGKEGCCVATRCGGLWLSNLVNYRQSRKCSKRYT